MVHENQSQIQHFNNVNLANVRKSAWTLYSTALNNRFMWWNSHKISSIITNKAIYINNSVSLSALVFLWLSALLLLFSGCQSEGFTDTPVFNESMKRKLGKAPWLLRSFVPLKN